MSKYKNSYSNRSPYSGPTLQDEEKKEPETKTGIVFNCDAVNVRSTPSKKTPNNIITVLEKGTSVKIIEKIGAWDRVELHDGTSGYILAQFLMSEDE